MKEQDAPKKMTRRMGSKRDKNQALRSERAHRLFQEAQGQQDIRKVKYIIGERKEKSQSGRAVELEGQRRSSTASLRPNVHNRQGKRTVSRRSCKGAEARRRSQSLG
jgi:hypothetical protein